MLLIVPGPVTTGLTYTSALATVHANMFFTTLAGGSQDRLDEIYWRSPKNTPTTAVYEYETLSGYIPWLEKKLACEDIKTKYVSQPPNYTLDPRKLTPLTLRFYQTESVETLVKYRHGITKLPTGTGKTRTAAGLILSIPCRWLYLVHRRALKSQTIKSLRELGVRAFNKEELLKRGQTQGSMWGPEPCVLVATWQSLVDPAAEPLLRAATGLIVDEVHRVAGEKYLGVVLKTTNAWMRAGFSATPLARDDGRDVFTVGVIGPIVYERTARELAEHGAISKGRVIFHDYKETLDLNHHKEYAAAYKEGIAHSKARNKKVCDVTVNVPKPALILVRDVINGHGQELCKLIEKEGLTTTFIHGSDTDEVRETAIAAMTTGDIDVLVSTLILEEGVDMPNLKSLVVAAGGASTIQAIQREGRPIRKHASKTMFELHDFKDTSHSWFKNHTQKRADAYASVGFAVLGVPVKKTDEDWEEEEEYNAEVREFAPERLPESWDAFGIVHKGPEPDYEEVTRIAMKYVGRKLFYIACWVFLIGGVLDLLGSC